MLVALLAAPAVALLFGSSPLAERPGQSESQKLRDWWVVCDNVRTCTAMGFQTGEIRFGAGPYVWLRRAPGPDAELEVAVGLGWADMENGAAAGERARLRVEGRTPRDFDGVVTQNEDTGVLLVRFRGERALALVAAMTDGERITVTSAGKPMGQISLSGSSASLRFIDDRQGRAGGVTALVAKGPKPASAVPAAPPLPVVRLAPAVAQDDGEDGLALPPALARLHEVKQCIEDNADEDGGFSNVGRQRLSQTEYLWAVPCGRGAYNFSSRYFIAARDGSSPRSAGLEGYDDTLVNGGYDPESRTLQAFSKGRGIGDCGDESEWGWDGRRFRLIRRTFMDECLGVPSEMWPTFYQARTE